MSAMNWDVHINTRTGMGQIYVAGITVFEHQFDLTSSQTVYDMECSLQQKFAAKLFDVIATHDFIQTELERTVR